MIEKLKRMWSGWGILLVIHLVCYGTFFIWAIDRIKHGNEPQASFIILLFWMVALLIHVSTHFHFRAQGGLKSLERTAYREGFADAVRQLADRPDAVQRLALNDNGELLEIVEKPKRNHVHQD
jgi:hypothetical protein